MTERTLPGLDLTGFWPLGDNSWKDGMDTNLQVLSALTQFSVISRTTTLPGSPSDGAIYIVPSDAGSNANDVAIWDGPSGSEQWVYLTPKEGWRGWVQDDDEIVVFDGTNWVVFESGSVSSLFDLPEITASEFDPMGGDSYKVVQVNAAGDRIQFGPPIAFPLGTAGQVLTVNDDEDLAEWQDPASGGGSSISLQSTSSVSTYDVTNADLEGGVYRTITNGTEVTINVTDSLTGTEPITFEQGGLGRLSFVAGPNVTINAFGDALKTAGQYATATLIPKGSNTYTLMGNLDT